MKIAFGFLLADRLNHEALWRTFFEGTCAPAIFHCHAGHYRGGTVSDRQMITPTQRTSWRQTIQGHYALYEAFLNLTDCTHLCILSESCIPIQPYADMAGLLSMMEGTSLMSRLQTPAWFINRGNRTKRVIGSEMQAANASHEQWCILARPHVECLVRNKAQVLRNFQGCYADNEAFMGTALKHYGHFGELRNWMTTYTDWSGGGNHPRKFMRVTPALLASIPNECFFLRKVVPGANVSAVYERLGNDSSSALPAAPSSPPRLLVLVHLWYGELWEELFRYMDNIPFPFDCYVNLAEGMPGGPEYIKHLVERIGYEMPNARVFVSANRGRDVGGLFRLFSELPLESHYDAWLFIHGKKTPQARQGHGDKWRTSLLDAVLGSQVQVERCLAQLTIPDIGIVGSREWLVAHPGENYQKIQWLCNRMDIPYDSGPCIAGTMFWASGRLLDAWTGSGITQADFELPHEMANPYDGTLAHAWERAVSIHARSMGMRTIGIQKPNIRSLRPAGECREFGGHFHQRRPYLIEYETAKWPFAEAAKAILQLDDLSDTGVVLPLLSREMDTKTVLHERWYANWKREMGEMYMAFVREVLLPRFGLEAAWVQKVPSFRAQLKDNVGVGSWHQDCEFGHDTREVNFWLPFVSTGRTNCVQIETFPGSGVFEPHPVQYGQVMVFNGAYLKHGNVPNREGDRTSVDFRMIVPAHARFTGMESINGHAKFAPGSYFELIQTKN